MNEKDSKILYLMRCSSLSACEIHIGRRVTQLFQHLMAMPNKSNDLANPKTTKPDRNFALGSLMHLNEIFFV